MWYGGWKCILGHWVFHTTSYNFDDSPTRWCKDPFQEVNPRGHCSQIEGGWLEHRFGPVKPSKLPNLNILELSFFPLPPKDVSMANKGRDLHDTIENIKCIFKEYSLSVIEWVWQSLIDATSNIFHAKRGKDSPSPHYSLGEVQNWKVLE